MIWDVLGNLHVSIHQCEQAMSDVNQFHASRFYKHSPSVREAITYYLAHTQPGTVVSFNVTADDQTDEALFIGGEP